MENSAQPNSPEPDPQKISAEERLPAFLGVLDRVRRELVRRQVLAALLGCGLLLVTGLLLVAALDGLLPIREGSAFIITATFLAAAVVLALVLIARLTAHQPSKTTLAAAVEKRHPGFRDALICATEVSEKKGAQLGRIEKALIERVTEDSRELDFEDLALPQALRWRNLALVLGILLLFAVGFGFTRFAIKTGNALGVMTGQLPVGLVVEPGDRSVPENSDMKITAHVLRYQDEATIEYETGGTREKYPMYAQGEGRHNFTLYSISDTLRYRVTTPGLVSEWHQLYTFQPPAVEDAHIKIQPPQYTRVEPSEADDLQALGTVEGAQITFDVTTSGAASADLQITLDRDNAESLLPFTRDATNDSRFTLQMTAVESLDYSVKLTGPDGRTWKSPIYGLDVKPDLAPAVEALEPGKDTRQPPDGRVDIAGQASDDYGLTEIRLTMQVAGEEPVSGPLFDSETEQIGTPRNRYVSTPVLMEHLEVEDGDIVSYYFEAVDNREPEPNVSRSGIFFIEINEQIQAEAQEGAPGEQSEQMEVRSLIEGMKQAIRLAYSAEDAARQSEEALENVRSQLQSKLLETRTSAEQKIRKLSDLAGAESGFSIIDNMNSAMQHMQEAETAALEEKENDVIPPSQQALKDLLKVENELMQNTANQMASEMQSLGEQNPQEGEQQQAGEQQNPMEQLRESADDLQRLVEEQAALNQAMRSSSGQQLSQQELAQLQERQRDIEERTGEQATKLTESGLAGGALPSLETAQSQMSDAQKDLAEKDARAAAADGERAGESLSEASSAVRQQIQSVLRQQTEALANSVQELSQQQGRQAQQSREAGQEDQVSREQASQMMDQQENLREVYREMQNAARQLAGEVAKDAPRASSEIQRTLQEANTADTERDMTRAANALLYQRMDTAADSQDQAAQEIGEFAEGLQQAADTMPRLSQDQIARALDNLQRARAQMQSQASQQGQGQAQQPGQEGQEGEQGQQGEQGEQGEQGAQGEPGQSGEPSQQSAQSQQGQPGSQGQPGQAGQSAHELASETLNELAEALDDDQLREISGRIAPTSAVGTGAAGLNESTEQLTMAIQYIRQNLLQMESERRALLKRESAPPPTEYRQLVEEYFKILGGDTQEDAAQ